MAGDDDKGTIKLDPKIIATWLGVVIPLWGMIGFVFQYDQDVMKKSEFDMSEYVLQKEHDEYHQKAIREAAFKDLEARIERTEILVAVYSRNSDQLTESEKNSYDRARARLIQLEQQRDLYIGVQ